MLDALLGPSPIPLSAESPGQCSPSAMPGATAEARSHPQGGPWAHRRRSISRLRALRDSAGESSAVAFSIYGRVHDCPGGVVVCVFLVTHHPRFNRTYIHPRIKSGDSPRVRVDPRVTSEKHPARITVPRATVPDARCAYELVLVTRRSHDIPYLMPGTAVLPHPYTRSFLDRIAFWLFVLDTRAQFRCGAV